MESLRRAQQPQSRQAYADSMALAAAYGRPPEPRYEQPAPTYGDPGPYRAQEPLPSQLARPAKKKRPRRKHGELARGIVRRREDWDDHCLIEMDDGFEDVFCHRHRCQGKQLPEQGQVVDFKLHLSSKSLCWQSGFVTWEEGDMAELKRPEPPLDIPRAPRRAGAAGRAPPPQRQAPYGGYYDQRPRASSFDDRRARLPSDLSDGVTESSDASDAGATNSHRQDRRRRSSRIAGPRHYSRRSTRRPDAAAKTTTAGTAARHGARVGPAAAGPRRTETAQDSRTRRRRGWRACSTNRRSSRSAPSTAQQRRSRRRRPV
ncbi:unnamed protein product [Pelagomonas calceolata]|uniref:Uncharacterized protein n=1 Tax=Pelagomonas calceolata TaxID=35677 RepID=A0A8J2S2S5_9STRA|nr:unnamed protein product [Pelagomonas calceolata]